MDAAKVIVVWRHMGSLECNTTSESLYDVIELLRAGSQEFAH